MPISADCILVWSVLINIHVGKMLDTSELQRKRGQPKLPDSERKRRRKMRSTTLFKTRIVLGAAFERWQG